MSEEEIAELKRMFADSGPSTSVYWKDNDDRLRKIRAVGKPPLEPVPEPSDVAYLYEGGYVALCSVELSEFALVTFLTGNV